MYVCPNCKSISFNGYTRRDASITIVDAGEGNSTPQIMAEDENVTVLFKDCASCGQIIAEGGDNLVEATACLICGEYEITSLLEEGVCQACNKPRPDLMGLTENDYIKRILALEREINALKGPAEEGFSADDILAIPDESV